MAVDVELIDCACFTSARRHPEVLGRLGRTVLPFQVTAAAMAVGVGSFMGLLFTWVWWWHAVVPGVTAVLIILTVPPGLGRLAMVTSLGGRNPFLAAGGVLRYAFRCRAGIVAGRPARRRARRRIGGRVVMEGRS